MSQTREARREAERRRLARRKAERTGEAAPEWATLPDAAPATAAHGRTPNLYGLGLTRVTALALARSEPWRAVESVADVLAGIGTTSERHDTPTDWTRERVSDEDRKRDAVTRTTGAAGSRSAFAAVLATACRNHASPVGLPCWSVTTAHTRPDRQALCGARVRAAGYLRTATATPRPRGGGDRR